MTDSKAQARWRENAHTLGVLGQHFRTINFDKIEVRIPLPLAERAVAAWEYESEDGVLDEEDLDQRIQRYRSAALSLIGLCIIEDGIKDGDSVIAKLHPCYIGSAEEAFDDYY